MNTPSPRPWPTLSQRPPVDVLRVIGDRAVSVDDAACYAWSAAAVEIERQRQELQPSPASEPDTEDVLALAAIIREVGGTRLGAAGLAMAILAHPGSRWQSAAPLTGLSLEPPGCPAPGACGCPMERSPDAGLVRLLQRAKAELPAGHSLARQIGFALEGWGVAATPPDRDASIEAAWGDITPAEAMEGMRRLAGELAAPEVPPELVPVRFLVENSEAIIVSTFRGWAVKNDPLRLPIDGAWDVEPMPSSRTRGWISRHTFDTIRAAYEALLKAKEEQA